MTGEGSKVSTTNDQAVNRGHPHSIQRETLSAGERVQLIAATVQAAEVAHASGNAEFTSALLAFAARFLDEIDTQLLRQQTVSKESR